MIGTIIGERSGIRKGNPGPWHTMNKYVPALLIGLVLLTGPPFTCLGQSDTKPPKLINLSINPTTVNVSNGPVTTHWRMEVMDDMSGLTWESVDFFLGDMHLSTAREYSFPITNYKLTNAGALNYIIEFDMVFPRFAAAGVYNIRLQLEDAAQNLVSFVQNFPLGLPSAITVVNQPAAMPASATVATIPHFASGDGWQTTLRASGACSVGCVLEISTYDNNGILINTTTANMPASSSKWAKSIILPDTSKLVTGWIEVKATSSDAVALCASALFTNSVSKQEASSGSNCITQAGWESGAVGAVQYFYSHLSRYVSGVALLNKASTPLSILLQWRDESDNIAATRTITLLARQQMSFTSTEAVGKYGRFLVSPDPSMTQAQKNLFNTSVYSLGFQFSPFGSFTQLSLIN